MANSKKTSQPSGGGTAGLVISIATAAIGVIPAIIDKVEPLVVKKESDGTGSVTIPSLYDAGFPLTLEQASELLTNYGFKVLPSQIPMSQAASKYRACFDHQVIDSKPKQGQKAEAGSTVFVKYITKDVVEASQLIFEEEEKHKEEVKQAKAEKRAARVEQTKTLAVDTAKKAKDGFLKVIPHGKKQVKAIAVETKTEEISGPETER